MYFFFFFSYVESEEMFNLGISHKIIIEKKVL